MAERRPKAADIDDAPMLAAVRGHNDGYCGCETRRQWGRPHWAMRWDLELDFPTLPPKVVLAKCHQLIKRALLSGCGCGCRGDFQVTERGRELLPQ